MKAVAVYLCGDELPMALFFPSDDRHGMASARKQAVDWPQNKPRWMDKEIKEVELDEKITENLLRT